MGFNMGFGMGFNMEFGMGWVSEEPKKNDYCN